MATPWMWTATEDDWSCRSMMKALDMPLLLGLLEVTEKGHALLSSKPLTLPDSMPGRVRRANIALLFFLFQRFLQLLLGGSATFIGIDVAFFDALLDGVGVFFLQIQI